MLTLTDPNLNQENDLSLRKQQTLAALKLPSGKQWAPAEPGRVLNTHLSSRDGEEASALQWQRLLAHKSDRRWELPSYHGRCSTGGMDALSSGASYRPRNLLALTSYGSKPSFYEHCVYFNAILAGK